MHLKRKGFTKEKIDYYLKLHVENIESSVDHYSKMIDLYDIEDNDYDLIIRSICDGDVDSISEESKEIFKSIIATSVNMISEVLRFDEIFDSKAVDVSDIERTDADEYIEYVSSVGSLGINWEELGEISSTIPSISQFKSNEVTLNPQYVSCTLNGLGAIFRSIGRIPSDFKNGNTQSPHEARAFDITEFMRVYKNIKAEQNYTLDYIYVTDGHGGEPFPYTRLSGETPLNKVEDYLKRYDLDKIGMMLGEEPTIKNTTPYTRNIYTNNTPESYFELALLCITLRKFYLIWHSNYNNRIIIHRPEDLQVEARSIISDNGEDAYNSLINNFIGPTVSIVGDYAQVKFMTKEQNIGYSNMFFKGKQFLKKYDDVILKSNMRILY